MTERTIKIRKFHNGGVGRYGWADEVGSRQNIDLLALRIHIKDLDRNIAGDISIQVLKKFARRYRTRLKFIVYPTKAHVAEIHNQPSKNP